MAIDRELGQGSGQGPTVDRLNQFPTVIDLVFGAYGEASQGVWDLLDTMATFRLRSQGLIRGSPTGNKEMSIFSSQLRRRLSSSVMKANVKCLLERMSQKGEGVTQTGKKREWVRQEDEVGQRGIVVRDVPIYIGFIPIKVYRKI